MPNSKSSMIRLIAEIDSSINHQLTLIMNHTHFQSLEASWRSVKLLITPQSPRDSHTIKIKLLHLTHNEMAHDLLRASEFDQSLFFKKIYSEEFDLPGGEPFGLLIGDYYFSHKMHDISVLREIAKVAASAFAPFITAVEASFFDLSSYQELEPTLNLTRTLEQQHYWRWHSLRQLEESRFLGLILPRVLLRPAYKHCPLWGNTSYILANTIINVFRTTGWFSEMLNPYYQNNALNPRDHYQEYNRNIIAKPLTEVLITESMQQTLNQLGFIILLENRYSQRANFTHFPSVHKPQHYDQDMANANAKVGTLLHYLLCASRFAHTIKVMLRNKIGGFAQASECEQFLTRWINQYCAANTEINPNLKAKYPLRKAKIAVVPNRNNPGHYQCVLHLQPHYPLDTIDTELKLRTSI